MAKEETKVEKAEVEKVEVKKAKAEQTEIKEQKEKQEKQAFIYLGPTVKGGVLISGSIHKVIPEHLKGVFEKAPTLEKLFIEVKDVSRFKVDVQTQGSIAFNNYYNAIKELEEVKDEL